jgi:hypothetical protein
VNGFPSVEFCLRWVWLAPSLSESSLLKNKHNTHRAPSAVKAHKGRGGCVVLKELGFQKALSDKLTPSKTHPEQILKQSKLRTEGNPFTRQFELTPRKQATQSGYPIGQFERKGD